MEQDVRSRRAQRGAILMAMNEIDDDVLIKSEIRPFISRIGVAIFSADPLRLPQYIRFREYHGFLQGEESISARDEAFVVSLSRLERERNISLLEMPEVVKLIENGIDVYAQMFSALGLIALAWQFAAHPNDVYLVEESLTELAS